MKLREILAAQKKWFVDSYSKLQEHSEFIGDMVKHELGVTSCELKAQKHELKV